MESSFLDPVRPEIIEAHLNGKSNIASRIQTSLKPDLSPGDNQIAIIGADPKWANRVRFQLYKFASTFTSTTICDLGNLNTNSAESATSIAMDVASAGAIPVFIGMRPDIVHNMWKGLHNSNPAMQGLFVREGFPTWLHTVNDRERICFMGLQSHLLDNESRKHIEASNATWLRLSKMRDSLDETEPAIRDTHFLNFDLSAIRFSDLPSQISYSTSGLSSEEACRITRYAGLAPDLRFMILSGHDPLSPEHGPSANTTAQLLWYFASGIENRVIERPSAGDRFTQYVVHLQRFDFDLKFYKSNMSGRWWLELPSRESPFIFSCAYGDYLAACEDVVTDRVIACVEMSMNVTHG